MTSNGHFVEKRGWLERENTPLTWFFRMLPLKKPTMCVCHSTSPNSKVRVEFIHQISGGQAKGVTSWFLLCITSENKYADLTQVAVHAQNIKELRMIWHCWNTHWTYLGYITEHNYQINILQNFPLCQGLANYGPGAKSDCCLFLNDLGAKNYFYVFKWLK